MSARGWVVSLERAWDVARLRRASSRPPAHFRIEPYIGHGGPEELQRRIASGELAPETPHR